MKKMETVKKAYDEILEVIKKHRDILVFDVGALEQEAKAHLFGLELKEVHGLNINPKDVTQVDYYRQNDHIHISWYGEKYKRNISWPVDGRQPEDELLLQICYPTGAYIFGEDYPTKFFEKFWLELKSFSPDYIDEMNHGLYWKIERAKDVFNSYNDLRKKYYEMNKEDFKQRKIDSLKSELQKLQQ